MTPVANRLHRRVAGVGALLRKRTVLALGLWIGSGVGGVLAFAWLLAGPEGWRPGSDVPALLDALMLAWVGGGYLLYRRRTAQWFAEAPVTDAMEDAARLREGMLLGALELTRELPAGMSGSLARRAAERVAANLEPHSESELTGALGERVGGWTRRGLNTLIVVTVSTVALAIFAPGRSRGAWGPLASPIATAMDPVFAPILVMPGSVEILRGSDVQLEVEAPGRLEVEVSWQAAGDVARKETLVLTAGRGGYVFRSVGAPIEYRVVAADGATSESFILTPIDPLFVSDLVVGVSYPPHTGLQPDEYRGDPPPLLLPAGSRLTVEGRASRPLRDAALVDSLEAAVTSFEVDGVGFRGVWTPRRTGRFTWKFADAEGAPAEIRPDPLEITVVADSAPAIAIPLPGRDTILPMDLRQPLVLEARDDYGLSRIELVAYRVTAFGERHEPVVQGLELGGTRAALARPLLDLRGWELMPGDTVRYFARAIDNAPASHATETREYVLRMPDAAEMQREAEERLESVADRLEALSGEAARQAEENRDQAREAAANEDQKAARAGDPEAEAGFEERQELQRALEEQEALASEVDSLGSELEALEQTMEEAGQADPDFSDQLQELQDLMKELNGSDLQQRMDDLADALDRDDLQDANESLDEMAQQQEDFRQRLEESLERFRRAAVEQDFRATTSEAEELARQERALADAMKEADDPSLRTEQQDEVKDRTDQLESSMERLEERLRKLDEQDAADGVEKARESAESARQQMQEAGQSSGEQKSDEASEQADQAAAKMEEAAEQLQDAQQQMAQQKAEAAQEAMRRAADDALALARHQSELRQRMRGASPEEVAGMRSDEASLLQGVEHMARNLQEATQGAAGGSRELSAQMGRTMESLQKTIESMERRRGSTPSPAAQAEQAVGDLNQLALMAIAGAEQMGQQGQGQSGEDVAEQLEELAQQQGELMSETSQLMPMQLGQQAMSEQIQEMSQGQEEVASDLGDLADEPGSEESLGDLDKLAEEAAALAQQMAQGRLTPEMVQRQERLFHRLLDAGRSLEREEFSDERESEVAGAFETGEIARLTDEQLGALRYRLPDGERLQRLSPAVRQLVIEYFERLNRNASGGKGR
jgi:hypothetical protein